MAVTRMTGGAICGYCATGKVGNATEPIRMMIIAMTHATIGRRMKNRLNIRYLQNWEYLSNGLATHIASALLRLAGRAFGRRRGGLIGLDLRQRRLHYCSW